MKARNARKRAERHEAKEAERRPGEKLMEKADTGREHKRYSINSLRLMDRVMALWSEFHAYKLSDADGSRFLKEGGPLPTQTLLRQFFRWVADGSLGNVATANFPPMAYTNNTNVSQETVYIYAQRLFTSLKH